MPHGKLGRPAPAEAISTSARPPVAHWKDANVERRSTLRHHVCTMIAKRVISPSCHGAYHHDGDGKDANIGSDP
eukprot:15480372-Alexandrium_andersonii.AAC.1